MVENEGNYGEEPLSAGAVLEDTDAAAAAAAAGGGGEARARRMERSAEKDAVGEVEERGERRREWRHVRSAALRGGWQVNEPPLPVL